mmetsp:Transcript_34924/g.35114  ORF Transcript_34924/g.35114 Transcript_34924/m.35114 type:complete len:99 (+) Transcript_34924:292-588(+)
MLSTHEFGRGILLRASGNPFENNSPTTRFGYSSSGGDVLGTLSPENEGPCIDRYHNYDNAETVSRIRLFHTTIHRATCERPRHHHRVVVVFAEIEKND